MDINQDIINNIKNYVAKNEISLSKLANVMNTSYHNVWFLLNQKKALNVGDYIAICRAFDEPLDFFIPKE